MMRAITVEKSHDVWLASGRASKPDPLLCRVAMPLREVFYPMGFAVEISTNRREVLDAARESWGHSRSRQNAPMLRVAIGITDGGPTECPQAPVMRAQRHLLSAVADPHNHSVIDMNAGFAYLWLSECVLQHPEYLRYHFIESAVMILIPPTYAVPIHAACVSRYGRGMLLCGESGAGKSTLAYACAREGWTYTSDDASYILCKADHARVVGASQKFRFRPSSGDLFSELRGRSITPRAEGKPSVEVLVSDLPGIESSEEAAIHHIIFLKRGPVIRAELLRMEIGVALESFRSELLLTDEIVGLQVAALERLASAEAYELHYCDLQQAIHILEGLASRPSCRASSNAGRRIAIS